MTEFDGISIPFYFYMRRLYPESIGFKMNIKHILIISDIEGSSGCWDYDSSAFMNEKWPEACVGMSLDVDAVVKALFNAGVEKVTIKDFHRTAYNLIPELIDTRAEIVHGYLKGPVPGIGDSNGADALMMIGMHAPSGSDGFLAHTLTSRIARLTINGSLMSEAQLFSASVAPFGLRPIFFSGCPVACSQACHEIKGIHSFPIDKSCDKDTFDTEKWKRSLAKEAVKALFSDRKDVYLPEGPFAAVVEMLDGPNIAEKLACRWGYDFKGAEIFLHEDDIEALYKSLLRLCYFTPFVEKILPLGLHLFNLRGRAGLWWVRRRIRKT